MKKFIYKIAKSFQAALDDTSQKPLTHQIPVVQHEADPLKAIIYQMAQNVTCGEKRAELSQNLLSHYISNTTLSDAAVSLDEDSSFDEILAAMETSKNRMKETGMSRMQLWCAVHQYAANPSQQELTNLDVLDKIKHIVLPVNSTLKMN